MTPHPPPAASPDENLKHFLNDFLMPIACCQAREPFRPSTQFYRPLGVAVRFYGIDEQLKARPANVEQTARYHIRRALRMKTIVMPLDFDAAWARVERRSGDLSSLQYNTLFTYFVQISFQFSRPWRGSATYDGRRSPSGEESLDLLATPFAEWIEQIKVEGVKATVPEIEKAAYGMPPFRPTPRPYTPAARPPAKPAWPFSDQQIRTAGADTPATVERPESPPPATAAPPAGGGPFDEGVFVPAPAEIPPPASSPPPPVLAAPTNPPPAAAAAPPADPVALVVERTDLDDRQQAELIDRVRSVADPAAAEVACRTLLARLSDLGGVEKLQLLFDSDRATPDAQFVATSGVPDDLDLWFVGDLHGDLLALDALLDYVRRRTPAGRRAGWVFLGDLFDDGPFGHLVVLRVLQLMAESPGQVTLVAGNHDEALYYRDATGRFATTVDPGDFADWLNEQPAGGEWHQLGRSLIDLVARVPRALLLPDGLLVAHGGVPHTDLQQRLTRIEQLEEPEFRQDFVWTRAHESVKRRSPNRSTKGCSFGIQDFDAFCDKLAVVAGRPVWGMIRGHDHVPDRYCHYPKYVNHPVLTVNAMSYRQRDVFGDYVRIPCAAKWVKGRLPEVHRVSLGDETVRTIYPDGAAGETDVA